MELKTSDIEILFVKQPTEMYLVSELEMAKSVMEQERTCKKKV